MGVAYNPACVTSGLVLYLDAGNVKSYPGSGVTWTDLSGYGNNAILTSGPTFDGANGGSILFDGIDDTVPFYAPYLGAVASVEMWVKLGAAYSGKMFMGWNAYDVWCYGGAIGFNTANADVYGISSATVTALNCVGNWAHYLFEFRSDVSYVNNKIYINTNQQTLSQQLGGENTSYRNFNSGNGNISGWRFDINYRIPMNCSVFKIYNRSLSSIEILQNFNALRGRYGL